MGTTCISATLTNVNFNPARVIELAEQAQSYKAQLKDPVITASTLQAEALPVLPAVAQFELPLSAAEILAITPQVAVSRGHDTLHVDVIGPYVYCACMSKKVQRHI